MRNRCSFLDSIRVYFCAICWALSTSVSTRSFAQGVLAVNPISHFSAKSPYEVVFFLQNLSAEPLELKVTDQCVVDGKKLDGSACLRHLRVDPGWPDSNGGKLKFEPGERRQFRVAAKDSVKIFALFKPLLDPLPFVSGKSNSSKGNESPANQAGLEFGYQPGFLILRPQEEMPTQVEVSSFELQEAKGETFARFVLNLGKLPFPSVFNVSAKVTEDGKLLRFFSLAKEKIFDPDRKSLSLEAQVGKVPEKASKICYEVFFQNQVSLRNGKTTGCAIRSGNILK